MDISISFEKPQMSDSFKALDRLRGGSSSSNLRSGFLKQPSNSIWPLYTLSLIVRYPKGWVIFPECHFHYVILGTEKFHCLDSHMQTLDLASRLPLLSLVHLQSQRFLMVLLVRKPISHLMAMSTANSLSMPARLCSLSSFPLTVLL